MSGNIQHMGNVPWSTYQISSKNSVIFVLVKYTHVKCVVTACVVICRQVCAALLLRFGAGFPLHYQIMWFSIAFRQLQKQYNQLPPSRHRGHSYIWSTGYRVEAEAISWAKTVIESFWPPPFEPLVRWIQKPYCAVNTVVSLFQGLNKVLYLSVSLSIRLIVFRSKKEKWKKKKACLIICE